MAVIGEKMSKLTFYIVDVFAETEKDPGKPSQSNGGINIFRHKRKDGTLFPVEITGCTLTWKNRKTFCTIVRDISGRELLEH